MMKKVASGLLAVGTILAIAATISPTMYTQDVAGTEVKQGIWKTEAGDTSTDNECDLSGPDCADASNAKCKTIKAFAIIGILSNAAALGLTFTALPAIAGVAAAGTSAFSYLIVWAISASIKNASAEDCGYGDNDDLNYGASFGLFIVAWVFAIFGAVLFFKASQEAK